MPAPNTAAEIGREVVERMAMLVREMAGDGTSGRAMAAYIEARAIVALLPAPVDLDLIEARKLAATRGDDMDAHILAGSYDNFEVVAYRLEGIKRGRELAKGKP